MKLKVFLVMGLTFTLGVMVGLVMELSTLSASARTRDSPSGFGDKRVRHTRDLASAFGNEYSPGGDRVDTGIDGVIEKEEGTAAVAINVNLQGARATTAGPRGLGYENARNAHNSERTDKGIRKQTGEKRKLGESDPNRFPASKQALNHAVRISSTRDQNSNSQNMRTHTQTNPRSPNQLGVSSTEDGYPSKQVQVRPGGRVQDFAVDGPILSEKPSAVAAAANSVVVVGTVKTDKISGVKDDVTRMNERELSRPVISKQADSLTARTSGLSDLVSGVYWSPHVDLLVPHGFTDTDLGTWRQQVERGRVVRLTEGCGRMQNRVVTLDDGSTACARYRLNTDLMQGEIFSYYLARLLGIRNLPPAVMVRADGRTPAWAAVSEELSRAQWNTDKVVILTRWVDKLSPSFIPEEFKSDTARTLNPRSPSLLTKSLPEIIELVQWSDLIVFDYITANLDRVVNNMFNKQWNHRSMDSPTHNLEKSTNTHQLVYVDNESGLFHGYRLLDTYATFHKQLLDSLCLFRKSTAEAVARLHEKRDSVAEELMRLYREHEPLHRALPPIRGKNAKILQQRISDVYHHIESCKQKFIS